MACRQLLDATPDVNVSDSNGQTPLLSAIAASFMEGVMLLLIRGADVTLAGHVHARREAAWDFKLRWDSLWHLFTSCFS